MSATTSLTERESDEGVHYLSLVTGAYSRKFMGYEPSHNMKATDIIRALQQAARNRQRTKALIHHSDRGIQYCPDNYQTCLKKNKINPSMTDGYDCYQNALAEHVNGNFKQEFYCINA